MSTQVVRAPLGLLGDPNLTAADKLVWICLRHDSSQLHDNRKLASPTRLAANTRLGRRTIYRSFERLKQAGWFIDRRAYVSAGCHKEPWVNIPTEMLSCINLSPRDIVMYGLLQDKRVLTGKSEGHFTYLSLSKKVHYCVKTVRRAIHALAEAHWITKKQKNRLDMIKFRLDNPRDAEYRARAQWARTHLYVNNYSGEAIAQAMVVSILKPKEYHLNSKINWLVNPDTGMPLEVDMWVPEYNLAIEFNGAQHYGPTSFCSAEESRKQQARDAHKARILAERKVNLVILRTEDLSIESIFNKLSGLAPLEDFERLDDLQWELNKAGQRYQVAAQRNKAAEAARR